MGHQIAGVLAVVGRVGHRHRLAVQLRIDVDKGEQARVGQGLAGLVAADALDVGFNADKMAVGVDHTGGVVQGDVFWVK